MTKSELYVNGIDVKYKKINIKLDFNFSEKIASISQIFNFCSP